MNVTIEMQKPGGAWFRVGGLVVNEGASKSMIGQTLRSYSNGPLSKNGARFRATDESGRLLDMM